MMIINGAAATYVPAELIHCKNGHEIEFAHRYSERLRATFYGAQCECDSVGSSWLSPVRAARALNRVIELGEEIESLGTN